MRTSGSLVFDQDLFVRNIRGCFGEFKVYAEHPASGIDGIPDGSPTFQFNYRGIEYVVAICAESNSRDRIIKLYHRPSMSGDWPFRSRTGNPAQQEAYSRAITATITDEAIHVSMTVPHRRHPQFDDINCIITTIGGCIKK